MKKLQHTTYYKLYQEKVKKDFSIISMSDLHFSNKVTNKKLESILHTIEQRKPQYILIPGDLIDSSNMIEKESERIRLYTWVSSLAQYAKVIISLGNHDYYQRGKFLDQGKRTRVRYFYDEKFFQSLRDLPNVSVLDNATYEDENVYIASLTLPFAYYRPTHRKGEKKTEDKRLLLKTMDQNKQVLTFLPREKIKILLVHSPVFLKEKKVEEILKEFDYFLAGHMHNGCVFPGLDELWNKTTGIISPQKTFFPKNVRNTLNKEGDKLIVNGALTTFQACTKWMQLLNILFPMNITEINFTKEEKLRNSKIEKKSMYHQ